jgi:hypothetical protein
MDQVQSFLAKPLLSLNGFQLTIGITLLAVVLYVVIWRK